MLQIENRGVGAPGFEPMVMLYTGSTSKPARAR